MAGRSDPIPGKFYGATFAEVARRRLNTPLSEADDATEVLARFCVPFDDVKVLKKGSASLDYITARQAMNRLDQVVGPDNWEDDYTEMRNGVKCTLRVRFPDGTWVTKTGTGGYVDARKTGGGLSDEDTEKTGESDAIKRAFVKFGGARNLYKDGLPDVVLARWSAWVREAKAANGSSNGPAKTAPEEADASDPAGTAGDAAPVVPDDKNHAAEAGALARQIHQALLDLYRVRHPEGTANARQFHDRMRAIRSEVEASTHRPIPSLLDGWMDLDHMSAVLGVLMAKIHAARQTAARDEAMTETLRNRHDPQGPPGAGFADATPRPPGARAHALGGVPADPGPAGGPPGLGDTTTQGDAHA